MTKARLISSTLALIFFCVVHVSGFKVQRLRSLMQLPTPSNNLLFVAASDVGSTEQATGGAEAATPAAVSLIAPASVAVTKPSEYRPDGTAYITCGACKTAYVVQDAMFRRGPGARVKCSVCNKEWFQNGDKLQTTDGENRLMDMSQTKVDEVKRILADRNFPKYPRVDKVGVFIGNLPYTYDETDILNLLAEYGVASVSLVKDPEGQSKGFAFAEVTSNEDAELLIKEMHHFYTDPNRKLTVRLADKPNGRPGSGDRTVVRATYNPSVNRDRSDRGERSYRGGGGGGSGGGGGGGGGGKPWERRATPDSRGPPVNTVSPQAPAAT